MMMTKTQNLIKNKMDLCGKGKFFKKLMKMILQTLVMAKT